MSKPFFNIDDEVVNFFGCIGSEDDISETNENKNIAKVYEYAVKRGALFAKHGIMDDSIDAQRKAREYKIISETLGMVLLSANSDQLIEIFKQTIFDKIECDPNK